MVTVPLPVDWLPDEIVYSLASRYHRVAANRSSHQTSRCLFGSGTAGGDADIPTSLRLLAERAEGALGSAEDMIFNHTALPAYSPFMTLRGAQDICTAMQGSALSPRRLRALLNIGAHDVALRACRACMTDDRKHHAVAYWHRSHQLPCTWACLKHKQLLLTSDVTGRDSWLHRWRLPDEAVLHEMVRTDALELWLRCASVACRLAALPQSFNFDAGRLHLTYASRACTSGVPVETQALLGKIPLAPHHARALARAVSGVCTQSVQGFRTQLHVPLIAILFGSWKHFWNAYTAVESSVPQPRCKHQDEKRRFFSLLKQGNSTTSAARLTGVDVTTGLVWAASANITSAPRPKILHKTRRGHAISLLELGADKAAVAAEVGVSVVSVTRLLGVIPQLRTMWTHARLISAIEAAKLRLSRLTETAPDLSAKSCRSLEPGAYALLYRRDREWLLAFLAERPKRTEQAHSQGDIDARSAALLSAAQPSLLHSATTEAHAADILVSLPSLVPVGANLSLMPRTRKAIQDVLRALDTRQLSLF